MSSFSSQEYGTEEEKCEVAAAVNDVSQNKEIQEIVES